MNQGNIDIQNRVIIQIQQQQTKKVLGVSVYYTCESNLALNTRNI